MIFYGQDMKHLLCIDESMDQCYEGDIALALRISSYLWNTCIVLTRVSNCTSVLSIRFHAFYSRLPGSVTSRSREEPSRLDISVAKERWPIDYSTSNHLDLLPPSHVYVASHEEFLARSRLRTGALACVRLT